VPNGIQTEEEEKEALKGGKGPEQRQRGGEKQARRAREEDANLFKSYQAMKGGEAEKKNSVTMKVKKISTFRLST